MESVTIDQQLEKEITDLLSNNPNLTNQEIRKRLHQNKSNATKYQINTTLHTLARKGVLVYQIKDTNKYWKLVLGPSQKDEPVKVEVETGEDGYQLVLEKVKTQAAIWKTRNPTNVFPTRPDRIANFIENCALKGLSLELRTKIAQDLFKNGWD